MRGRQRRQSAAEIVALLRRDMRRQGFPTDSDAWRIAAYLADLVTVEIGPERRAYSQINIDGTALIVIPEHYSEAAKARALLEELGHILMRGLHHPPATEGALNETGRRRLLLLWQDREEAASWEWLLCWRLPEEELVGYLGRDEELAEDSGCSLDEIEARRKLLIGC